MGALATDRPAREQAASRTAATALARPIPPGRRTTAPAEAAKADPQDTFDAIRPPLENAMGHEFSKVRIHASGAAAATTRALGARAVTYGNRIAFAPGEWSPGTRRGINLLAHELAHVVGQAREGGPRLDAKTLDEEVDEELAAHAGTNTSSLDPKNKDYAMTLQDYGFKQTHSGFDLLEEPKLSPADAKDPKKKAQHEKDKAAWKRKFQKAELLAGRILDQSGPGVQQKESRAQMLTADLATSGFIDEAMALSRKFTDPDQKKFIYNEVLKRSDKVTGAQLAEILKFFVAKNKLDDNPVVQKLDDEGAYSKELGPDKGVAALSEIVKSYGSEPGLAQKLARLLFFDGKLQAGFSKWMLENKKGDLLRKISEQPYFVEGAKIGTTAGTVNPSEATLAWAISNKQKVTVQDLVDLTKAAGKAIKEPAKYDAATLRAWLEANTDAIGAAIKKQYPSDPDAAEAVLNKITGAFMWHVDPDAEDIKPDKSGKITHLTGASGGQKTQLKVDCDVLATYSVRLLVAGGFTPVGYMAVVPTDKSRAAHAMALLQHGQSYRALSNVTGKNFPVTKNKDDALKILRDFGISEAYDPTRPLTGYKIYYQDSDAKGTLPDEVLKNDPSAEKASLSK